MAHIPMDDIEKLWQQSPQHNWQEFQRVLEQHKGKAEGVADQLVADMQKMAAEFQKSNKPFPSSPQELYNELNQQLHKMGAK
jgi:hypothetical protein